MRKRGDYHFLVLAILVLTIGFGFLTGFDYSQPSNLFNLGLEKVSSTGGKFLTGAAIGLQDSESTLGNSLSTNLVVQGDLMIQGDGTCNGNYTGGDWTINTSVSCSDDTIAVNGTVTIQDLSETAVTEFSTSSNSAYDLSGNSSAISTSPDLVKDESAYTAEWDSSSDEFYIMMNESEHQLQMYINGTITYFVDLDSNSGTGGSDGMELVLGYHPGAGFDILGCYNATLTDFDFYVGDDSASENSQLCDTDLTGADFNFTIYWNKSASHEWEIVIDADGSWTDKLFVGFGFGGDLDTNYYTAFKNSAVIAEGLGNLTLNNVTLNLENHFTVDGVLNVDNSNITFNLIQATNFSGLTFNSGSNVVINNTNIQTNDSSFYTFIYSTSSDFVLSNGLVNNLGTNGPISGITLSSTNGGMINNVTFGSTGGSNCITLTSTNHFIVDDVNCSTKQIYFGYQGNSAGTNNSIINSDVNSIFLGGTSNLISNSIIDNLWVGSEYASGNGNHIFHNNTFPPNSGLFDQNETMYNILVYNNSYGEILWNLSNLNLSAVGGAMPNGLGFDNNIFISDNFVGVADTDLGEHLATINTTAQIKFFDLNWTSAAQLCDSIGGTATNCITCNSTINCTYSNTTGILVANVTHFSNYTTNGSLAVEEEPVTYLSAFNDTFDGTEINATRYDSVDDGLTGVQNDKIIVNGTDASGNSNYGLYLNYTNMGYLNMSSSFYFTVDINVTNTSAITDAAGLVDYRLYIDEPTFSNVFAVCGVVINQTTNYLTGDDTDATTVELSTTAGTLVLAYNATSYNYTCYFGGESITNVNQSSVTGNYFPNSFIDAYYTSVNGTFDNFNFTYGDYVPAEEAPVDSVVIRADGFSDSFTSLNNTFYSNTSGPWTSSISNEMLFINKTQFENISEYHTYSTLFNASINSFNITVWVNLSNTTSNAEGAYLIESGISLYNLTNSDGSIGCSIVYVAGFGLFIGNYNDSYSSPPSTTSVSRSYGNLTYSYDSNTGIFNCSLDDLASVATTTPYFYDGMPVGIYSSLRAIDGSQKANASLTVYFDDLNYSYVPAEEAPAVTYLSDFNDTFDGATINTSFYSTLPYGMDTSQNNKIIINGSGNTAGGISSLNPVNVSDSFEIYVNLTLANSSEITGDNTIATGIFVSNFEGGADFVRCKVEQNSSGYYLNEPSSSNRTSVNTSSGTLHLTYNASSNYLTCSFAGQSVSGSNESALASNYTLSLVALPEGSDTGSIAEWNTTFDDLMFSYGISVAEEEEPVTFYASYSPFTLNGVDYDTNVSYMYDLEDSVSYSADNQIINQSGNYSLLIYSESGNNYTIYTLNSGFGVNDSWTCTEWNEFGLTCMFFQYNVFTYINSTTDYVFNGSFINSTLNVTSSGTYPPSLTVSPLEESYCGGAYTGGNWTIDSSISCSDETISVDGYLNVVDNSETSVTQFNASTDSAYDLRGNSSEISSSIPDLIKDESAYTADWDSDASREFYVLMNETANKILLYINNTDLENTYYMIDVDDNSDTGVSMGYSPGTGSEILVLVNYTGLSSGVFCWNTSDQTYVTLLSNDGGVCDNSFGGNSVANPITVYANFSADGNVGEVVIDVNGSWSDYKIIRVVSDSVYSYTTFKNSSVVEGVGLGNLTLNNVTLSIDGNLAVSGLLNVQSSNIEFQLTGNGSSNFSSSSPQQMIINSSIINSSIPSYYFGVSLDGDSIELLNSNFSQISYQDGQGDAGSLLSGEGMVVSGNTFTNCGNTFYADGPTATTNLNFSNNVLTGSCSIYSSNLGIKDSIFYGNSMSSGEFKNGLNITFENNVFQSISLDDNGADPAENLTFINNNITFYINDNNNTKTNTLIYNNSFGQIAFVDKANLSVSRSIGLNDNIIVENNTLGLSEKSGLTNLNSSAQLLFYGLSWLSDEQLCSGTNGDPINCVTCDSAINCTYNNLTGVMQANVTHFSNYTTNGSIAVADAGVLSISVSKTALNQSALSLGDVVPYLINITNDGDTNITDLIILDYYDTDLNYTSASIDPNSTDYDNQLVNWTLGSLTFEPESSTLIYVNFTSILSAPSVGNTINVTAIDTEAETVNQSSSVSVYINSYPVLTQPAITPATAYTNDTLTANTTYTDTDDDSGTVYLLWYVDAVNVYNQTNTSVSNGTTVITTLSSSYFNKTNVVNLSVYSNDGLINSTTSWSSNTITITNLAPSFDEDLTAQTINYSQTLAYDINCSDVDSDTLTYYDNTSLFNINSSTGLITDTPTQEEIGAYTINISCDDGTINTSQTFLYNITDGTAPVIRVTAPVGPTNETTSVLNATTDENATCYYKNSTADYIVMSNTGNTTHSQSITGLSLGNSLYYVLCNDSFANSATQSFYVLRTNVTANTSNTTFVDLIANSTTTLAPLTDLNLTLNVSETLSNVSVSAAEFTENPEQDAFAISGYTVTGFHFFTIDIPEITDLINKLTLRFSYNETELTAAGISEADLKPFYYNATSELWVQETEYSVDTTNDYLEVNVTHLTTFVLGTSTVIAVPETPASSGGSGSGGGSAVITPVEEEPVTEEPITPEEKKNLPTEEIVEEIILPIPKTTPESSRANLFGKAVLSDFKGLVYQYKWVSSGAIIFALIISLLLYLVSTRKTKHVIVKEVKREPSVIKKEEPTNDYDQLKVKELDRYKRVFEKPASLKKKGKQGKAKQKKVKAKKSVKIKSSPHKKHK
ncbi:hypothetical protein COY27_00570 [Candidatus Woesearchaeota archaeon CG_4_10_14_0_2_um_filter_33_13]|nr:MAG: hypothetical protein COY27_00570 [Candidatus Woesearchaeota archaeon CG_4_10_14_0_2_um_filter_33_13]